MKRALVASILLLSFFCATGEARIAWGGGGKCQILDKGPLPLYTLSGTYIEESDFQGGTDTGLFELNASWGCAYFTDVLDGDIDTHFRLGSVFFLQTASLDLPESVSEISFDLAWIRRLQNGMSIVVGLTPGIYSDLEMLDGDGLFMPVRVAGVKTFTPRVSAIAGLEYRAGFDRELLPIIGIEWEPDKMFRIEAGLPESLIRWRPDDIWTVYAKFVWSNISYNLRDRDNDNREQLTLEDYRSLFGLHKMIDDRIGLFFEGGNTYHRSIAFERSNATSIELDIDKAKFVRIGLGGYF